MRRSGRVTLPCVLVLGFVSRACAAERAVSATQHPHHLVRQDEVGRNSHKHADNSSSWGHKIPALLHYVYLDGFDAFMEAAAKPDAVYNRTRFELCQSIHSHWDSMFWDTKMADQLVKEHYSWFLPIWKSYKQPTMRSDAIRPMILHQYGGMYLDLDVECYKPADASLEFHDVVLQGGGDQGFHNAAMASVPGHDLWVKYMKMMEERHKDRSPMWATGTDALTRTTLDNVFSPVVPPRPVSGYIGGLFKAGDTNVMIYPLGEWYQPCFGLDIICIEQFEKEKAAGTWDMSHIYGRHYFDEIASPRIIAEKVAPHNITRDA